MPSTELPFLSPPPNADFAYWWAQQGEWVEEANQRRGGRSGVQLLPPAQAGGPLLYSKRQQGHLYRTLRHPWGRPTILRERDAYQALRELGIQVPGLVFAGARRQHGQWQALLVSEALQPMVSLDDWYATAPAPELRGAVIEAVALMLAKMHRGRWQHGCCYPKHIFVAARSDPADLPRVEVALLDLEKCRRRLRASSAARRDLDQLGRHWGSQPAADLEQLRRRHAEFFAQLP